MKAAVLYKKNDPLIIEDVELPDTLDYGQVIVKVLVSGICGAQIQEIAGLKGNEKFMPHLLGHEGCGIVEAIGPGVTKVKFGDKVVMHWRKGSGIEAKFPVYKLNGKSMSGGKVTTLSEYSVVSENRLTRVALDTHNDFVALLGCGLSTGFAVVNKDANIKFGESVLILGCGGVGLNCIYAASLSQAYPIYGVDIAPEKEGIVTRNGGIFFNGNEYADLPGPFDCIIDTTGNMALVSRYLPLLSERGRCILVAQPKPDSQLTVINPGKLFSTGGQCIRTTQAGGFDPDSDIPRYLNLYKNQLIKLQNLITDRYSLLNINSAVDQLRSGRSGRIMIDI